jgi:hypothetical protein
MEERAEALIEIVDRSKPCTVRQAFYQATVRGIVEKSETGYDKVQRQLVDLRRAGRIPYESIADNTRWQRKPSTFDSLHEAIEETARTYRRAMWTNADVYLEIWLEKDALAGVVIPVTARYDVPLMVARGYSSLSFLHTAAEYIAELEKPAYLYHLGDFDPSGQDAADKIEYTLREMAPDAEIRFERLAVKPWHIAAYDLQTRPTKTTDSRAKKWGHAESVELDAIDANRLRFMVESAITMHVDQQHLKALEVAEQSERDLLRRWGGIASSVAEEEAMREAWEELYASRAKEARP